MAQVLRFSELSPVRQVLVRICQTAAALAFLARAMRCAGVIVSKLRLPPTRAVC